MTRRSGTRIQLRFPVVAALAAAACGWPASALVVALGAPAPTADAGVAEVVASTPPIRHPRPLPVLATSLVLAALAFGVAVRVHPAAIAAAGRWLVASGLPMAIIDARQHRLPDVLTAARLARRPA
jgi:hypothetical protein